MICTDTESEEDCRSIKSNKEETHTEKSISPISDTFESVTEIDGITLSDVSSLSVSIIESKSSITKSSSWFSWCPFNCFGQRQNYEPTEKDYERTIIELRKQVIELSLQLSETEEKNHITNMDPEVYNKELNNQRYKELEIEILNLRRDNEDLEERIDETRACCVTKDKKLLMATKEISALKSRLKDARYKLNDLTSTQENQVDENTEDKQNGTRTSNAVEERRKRRILQKNKSLESIDGNNITQTFDIEADKTKKPVSNGSALDHGGIDNACISGSETASATDFDGTEIETDSDLGDSFPIKRIPRIAKTISGRGVKPANTNEPAKKMQVDNKISPPKTKNSLLQKALFKKKLKLPIVKSPNSRKKATKEEKPEKIDGSQNRITNGVRPRKANVPVTQKPVAVKPDTVPTPPSNEPKPRRPSEARLAKARAQSKAILARGEAKPRKTSIPTSKKSESQDTKQGKTKLNDACNLAGPRKSSVPVSKKSSIVNVKTDEDSPLQSDNNNKRISRKVNGSGTRKTVKNNLKQSEDKTNLCNGNDDGKGKSSGGLTNELQEYFKRHHRFDDMDSWVHVPTVPSSDSDDEYWRYENQTWNS